MPRKPRFNLIGIPQYVIQHGNNCEPCFHAAEDCRFYLNEQLLSGTYSLVPISPHTKV